MDSKCGNESQRIRIPVNSWQLAIGTFDSVAALLSASLPASLRSQLQFAVSVPRNAMMLDDPITGYFHAIHIIQPLPFDENR